MRSIIKRHGTSDPFQIAENLGIKIVFEQLDKQGIYLPINDQKVIILNENLKNNPMAKFVMAHELYHAIEHTDLMALYHNGYMVKSKKEREANQFATYLCLIGQTIYAGQTKEQICRQCYIPLEMEEYL
ncbi:protein of unknown function [Ignavigranum ruoffiae]|uniref:IrrE N-terminal-like domain-containing protein n=1 Tax=Ignavigranum ruoffiae TaxID=89093 RepID=A0A1H9H7F2_9LACT|nr:ImmA/IrrE family metallo-endopeptidase [Ignavigranum ruoffiae]SEQ58259.1 protein of unknown function [Ignavigranum ruoffiae]